MFDAGDTWIQALDIAMSVVAEDEVVYPPPVLILGYWFDHGASVVATAGIGPPIVWRLTSTTSPPPALATARTEPSWALAMALTIERPSPEPSSRVVRSGCSRRNGSNNRSTSKGWIGGPVLATRRMASPARVSVVTSSLTARDVMAGAVLDEVRREPFEQLRISQDNSMRQLGFDSQAAALHVQALGSKRALCHLRGVHGHAALEAPIASCQREQRFEQPLLPLLGDQDALECRPPRIKRRLRIAQGVLDQGALSRERRPEFMRGVGHELSLRLERPREPAKEIVEGLPEIPELVIRAVRGDPEPEVRARDLTGGVGHRAQRAQHAPHDEPADQDRCERQDRNREYGQDEVVLLLRRVLAFDDSPDDGGQIGWRPAERRNKRIGVAAAEWAPERDRDLTIWAHIHSHAGSRADHVRHAEQRDAHRHEEAPVEAPNSRTAPRGI